MIFAFGQEHSNFHELFAACGTWISSDSHIRCDAARRSYGGGAAASVFSLAKPANCDAVRSTP